MKKFYLLLQLIICFFIVFNLPSNKLSAQKRYGTAPIINYTATEYKASPQSFAAIQDHSGMMYFANYGQILQYDGTTWRHIPVENDLNVLSLAIDSLGIIYASAGSEFGYIAPDSLGLTRYFSLSKLLDSMDIHIEHNGKTFVMNNGIYFQTPNFIYIYKPESIYSVIKNNHTPPGNFKKPTIIPAQTLYTNSYTPDNNRFYVHQEGLGLMQLRDKEFKTLEHVSKFIERKTVDILPDVKEDVVVVATERGIFYYMENIGFGYFKSETDDYFNEMSLLRAAIIPNAYVLSTMNKGTIIMEEKRTDGFRNIIEEFDKQAGLATEQITSIYTNPKFDPYMIWMTSHYGITRTKIGSPIRKIHAANIVKDIIFDVKNHRNTIYVRTPGEIYYLKDTLNKQQFIKVKNLISNNDWISYPEEVTFERVEVTERDKRNRRQKKSIWQEISSLFSKKTDNPTRTDTIPKLLVATKNGLFKIASDSAQVFKTNYKVILKRHRDTTIYNLDYKSNSFLNNVTCLLRSQKYPRRVYLGTENGFWVLSQQHGKWILERKIEEINEHIASIAEDADGSIWLGIRNNGVIRIAFPHTKERLLEKIQRPEKKDEDPDTLQYYLLPDSLQIEKFTKNNGLPRLAGNGILFFNNSIHFATRKGLYRYNSSKKIFEPDNIFGTKYSDGTTHILAVKEDRHGNCWVKAQDLYKTEVNRYLKKNNSFELDTSTSRVIPNMTVQAMYPDTASGLLWISGTEGLFTLKTTNGHDTTQVPFNALIRKVTLEDSVIFWGSYTTHSAKVTHNQEDDFIPVLKINQKDIQFEYAAPYFDREKEILYRVYLKGNDDEWSEWTTDTRKEYTNLSNSEYCFKVQAMNVYGEKSTIAEFRFEKPKPWYERWWFYAIEVAFFLLILFLSIWLNRKGKQSSIITSILTMLTVVIIFKVLGTIAIRPLIEQYSGGIIFYRVVLDIIIGAILLPAWQMMMRLIKHGTVKNISTANGSNGNNGGNGSEKNSK